MMAGCQPGFQINRASTVYLPLMRRGEQALSVCGYLNKYKALVPRGEGWTGRVKKVTLASWKRVTSMF
jgi:hypothetical protein